MATKNLGATHSNLDHKAYTIIREMIDHRQLLPGEKIPQEKLARELGISRTPLINALKCLEREKLVEAKPRRGFYVRLFRPEEMIGIFELREVLEGLAARRAARQITDRQISRMRHFFEPFSSGERIIDTQLYAAHDRAFHNFVTEIGAREFLKNILYAYNIISFSYHVVSSDGLIRCPNETIGEHLTIVEAIADRDGIAAEEKMRWHFKQTICHLSALTHAGSGIAAPSSQPMAMGGG